MKAQAEGKPKSPAKAAAKAAATRPKPIAKRIAAIKAKPAEGQTNIANKYISFEGGRI